MWGFTDARSRINAPTRSRTTPHDQRHADPTSRAHEDNCPNSQPKCAIASTTFAQPFLLISRWNSLSTSQIRTIPLDRDSRFQVASSCRRTCPRRFGPGRLNSRCSEPRVVDYEAASTKTACRLRGAESVDRGGVGPSTWGGRTRPHVMGGAAPRPSRLVYRRRLSGAPW